MKPQYFDIMNVCGDFVWTYYKLKLKICIGMYKYINTQNMASDQTKVLNTITEYKYNTFIHTHTFFK